MKTNQYHLERKRMEQQGQHSVLYWIVIGFVLMFLFIAPYQTGLFYGPYVQYEGAIYSSMLWTAMVSLPVVLYLFTRWRLHEVRDWYAVAIWCIPLSFVLPLMAAATRHHAENYILLHIMYAFFFLIGLFFARERSGNSVIQYGIVVSAYAVVGFCVLNMFGNMYYHDAVMLTGEGLRLTAVFQYANAYAGFLIIPLLCGLYLTVVSRRWYVTAVHAFMLVPVLLSFFLTLSRGGLVMLPFIMLAFLPFLSFAKQVRFFAYLLIGSAASFLITDKLKAVATEVTNLMLERRGPDFKVKETLSVFDPLSFSGWSLLLIASIAASAVIVLVHKFVMPYLDRGLSRVSAAKWSNLYVPGLIIVGIVLGVVLLAGGSSVTKLLPEALGKRVESINLQQHSVLERFTMYRDTFKSLADYPVFGAGGNAWSVLYPQYANNPYTINQVHSFVLQYMVETGIFGLLLLLLLIGSIFYRFAKSYFAAVSDDRERNLLFYAVVVAILFHSMMDFEMSYVYVSVLVFLSLGGMASGFAQPVTWGWMKQAERKGRFVPPAIVGVLAVVFLILSAVHWKANREFYNALQLAQQGKSLQEVLVPLDKALGLQPDNPFYVLTRTDFMGQVYDQSGNETYYEDASRWLKSIKETEPYDRVVFEAEYKHYMLKNRLEDALELIQAGLRDHPWVIAMYEKAASLHIQLGDQARQAGQKDVMNGHWSAVLELHQDILARMKKLETLPEGQNPGDPFYVTPTLGLQFGQLHFVRGEVEQAVAFLMGTTDEKLHESIYKPGTRWYLAALKKTGKADQALYDRFTARYPEEKQEIENLVETVWQ
ncbi:MAG: O-antigen ligase protein [Paenibacillus sp.]|nr:O-antigen ligase protein [Paenibacillus sp.]